MSSAVLQEGIPTSASEAIAQYGDAIVSFGVTVLTFVVAFLALYLVGRPVLVRATKRALNARDLSAAVVSLGTSIAGTIAVFGAVAVAATVAGFPAILTAFATLAGALALGVGFAASDIIENFVAGVFIIKDKPFEVGDYIEWDGNGGVVRKIDLRVSKLDTWDNEQLTVPNGDLANAVVKNPVANEQRRITVDYGIDYGADIDLARDIIVEEASAIDGVLADPEPTAPVTSLGDSAVVLNGRLHIDPAETGAGPVKNAWIEAVKKRFDAEGVGMRYPHRELVGSLSVESPENATGPIAED